MRSAGVKAVVSFAVPAGAALLLAALALHFGMVPLGGKAVDYFSWAVFCLGLPLAWRFRSSRMAAAVASLALAQRGLLAVGTTDLNLAWVASCMVAVLLPANFIVLSVTPERGFRTAPLMFWTVLLALEAGAVAGVVNADDPAFRALFAAKLIGWLHVPMLAVLLYFLAFPILIARYVMKRRPVEAGLFWGLASAVMAFHVGGVSRAGAMYFGVGGLALVLALMEASYFMAYHDELTGLPGRRAFNEAMVAMEEQFTVAVVDIDHFKRFNDTYGHETGDQVLRMVAARLEEVTGGGRAFRTGGEEFCVVFRNHSLRDSLPHLDALREAVETSEFTLRGPDRPKRTAEDRRPRLGGGRNVSVTISIGVAQSTSRMISVEDVLRAADKALYEAKANGRNRVEVYRGKKKPVAAQTVGV